MPVVKPPTFAIADHGRRALIADQGMALGLIRKPRARRPPGDRSGAAITPSTPPKPGER